MKLKSRIFTAAMGAAALLVASPAFAAFDYSVSYTDASGGISYPATTTITTSNALTFFTVSPGGSATGSNLPTNIGLFSLVPNSTAPSGSFAVNETFFTTILSIQTVANLNGTGPIGSPGTLTITGHIAGSLGPDADTTTIDGLSLGAVPVNVLAGGVTYAVSLDSIENPGVISAGGNSGGVNLHIVAVPEPASMSLLGLASVGLLARRRK